MSGSAVSRTFTPGASVSGKTRKKVENAARELGYSPSLIARRLTTKRTKLIGLVANNFQNPVFLEVFNLYTRALQQRELRPLLVNLTNETDPDQSLRMLRQYGVDAVILASSTLPPEFSDAFRSANVPVVHAFGRFDPTTHVHVVGIDNRLCGRMAAETLVSRDYRKIAVIGGPGYASSTKDLVSGFRRRIHDLGLTVADISYAKNYTYAAGRDAMVKLLERISVEAVFCGDDLICIGFLGFDDMDMASWDAYRLTTIRQPIQDIILGSIELVDDRNRKPSVRLFPCSVVERSTLRPVSGNSAALRQSSHPRAPRIRQLP